MATKTRQMQRMIRYYKDVTGKTDVDMKEVAQFAIEKGWTLPKPISPTDRLAKEFAKAARDEIRHDKKTGKPYRANHAFRAKQGFGQPFLWIDIDEEAPRKKMVKSLVMRREQMVGDGLQLTFDSDHWNSIHSNEEPIALPMDFTDDIEWRKNAPEDKIA